MIPLIPHKAAYVVMCPMRVAGDTYCGQWRYEDRGGLAGVWDYHEFYHCHLGNVDEDFAPANGVPLTTLTFAIGTCGQTLAVVWMPVRLGGIW